MIFSCKRSNKKRDSNSDTPALATTNNEKRKVTIGRWNRLYYGFQHFDPSQSPKQETKKKKIVVTAQDMDMVDYCYHKVIASKDDEIEVLKQDQEYKDTEMEILKQKYRSLKHAALKQKHQLEAQAEYREREWAIEKKQLLQEIDWALRGVVPADEGDTDSDEDSIMGRKEEPFTRKEMSRKSPTSVRNLIQEREAQIAKHS